MSVCTFVLPKSSFHVKNLRISAGSEEDRDFLEFQEAKKLKLKGLI